MDERVEEKSNQPQGKRFYVKLKEPDGKKSGDGLAHQVPSKNKKDAAGYSDKARDAAQTGSSLGVQNKTKDKSLASKGVDKGLEQAAKKGAGTIAGEGANLVSAAKRAKDEGAGAGAQAAETAAAGIRAGASATGVGGAVVKGYDAAKKALSVVGVNVKDRYVVYLLLFGVFLFVLPIILFFLVVFFAWDNPRAILSLGWAGVKTFVGGVSALTLINHGGAGKLAFEVDKGNGATAIAAPIAAAPAPGTYEYKLAQIDWEKAKYQTLPNDTRCVIKTKKVVSTLDGKERSVIESVQLKTSPGRELEGVARANCINNTYPIFYTMMRSQFLRDGVNASLNVRFAYAEPTNSETLKKSPTEIQQSLRQKTLTRIWNRGKALEPTGVESAAEVEANDKQVIQDFIATDAQGNPVPTRTVQKYSVGKYDQTIVDCANNYIPEGLRYFDKDVDKMNHDLECGIEPKDLLLYTTLPDEATANDSNPDIAIRPKRAALNAVCDLDDRLLKDNDQAKNNYRETIKNRINSAAVAGWQAATYADTNRARYLNINELNKDFYKIAGMQSGQEYNYTLDGVQTGTPLEPDAVSRIQGYYSRTAVKQNTYQIDQVYLDGLQAIFDYVESPAPGYQDGKTYCDVAADKSEYSKPQSISTINQFWTDAYPKFKKAIAGLDYYARPVKSQSISQIYKNLTYEDLIFRTVRIQSNVATAGTEDGPQNFNRMNFGMKAYMNGVSLALGGKFLTDNQAVSRDESIRVAQQYDDQSRGLGYRLFDIKNPSSLTSRFRVAMTDKPNRIAGNVATVMANMVNPIHNLAGQKGTLTALVTGKSRVAMAASVYDKQNLKLDPAGIPEVFAQIDPIQNARYIEGLKKSRPDLVQTFTFWDQCYKEFIPSRFHLLNPSDDKKDLYAYCRILFEVGNGQPDPNSLEVRYSAYHFYNLQADALVYLSNPEKEDATLDAISSVQQTFGSSPTPAPGGGLAPAGGAGDTSAQQCPPGTTDAGIGTKYGVGKVPQYNIRLCKVYSTTVNVSVAANLLALFNAAKAAGITMSGGGYRTYDQQVALRTTNGCPDVYTAPSKSCATPTARPGESNHESGEAVDFTQNGSTLTSSSSGFRWMKTNAGTYFFYNLPSEPWHWSKDGK